MGERRFATKSTTSALLTRTPAQIRQGCAASAPRRGTRGRPAGVRRDGASFCLRYTAPRRGNTTPSPPLPLPLYRNRRLFGLFWRARRSDTWSLRAPCTSGAWGVVVWCAAVKEDAVHASSLRLPPAPSSCAARPPSSSASSEFPSWHSSTEEEFPSWPGLHENQEFPARPPSIRTKSSLRGLPPSETRVVALVPATLGGAF